MPSFLRLLWDTILCSTDQSQRVHVQRKIPFLCAHLRMWMCSAWGIHSASLNQAFLPFTAHAFQMPEAAWRTKALALHATCYPSFSVLLSFHYFLTKCCLPTARLSSANPSYMLALPHPSHSLSLVLCNLTFLNPYHLLTHFYLMV